MTRYAIALGLLLSCAACGSSSSAPSSAPPSPRSAAEELHRGMTYDQVARLLGKPSEDHTSGSERFCTWKRPQGTLHVSFDHGKARNIVSLGG